MTQHTDASRADPALAVDKGAEPQAERLTSRSSPQPVALTPQAVTPLSASPAEDAGPTKCSACEGSGRLVYGGGNGYSEDCDKCAGTGRATPSSSPAPGAPTPGCAVCGRPFYQHQDGLRCPVGDTLYNAYVEPPDAAFRATMPNTPVRAFDDEGEPIQHRGPPVVPPVSAASPPVGGAPGSAVQVQEHAGKTENFQKREPEPKEEGPMSDSRITTAYLSEVSAPGVATGRVVTLDRTIPIDEAYTDQPQLRWQCDHCEAMERVTAQFKTGMDEDGEDTHERSGSAPL
jgi:hypothetical protein